MREVDLKKLMQGLYESLDYYASIEPIDLNYEEEYHDVTIDPDGKKRYLLEEREQSLRGINEITTFLDECSPGKILDIGCGPGWLLSYLNNNWEKYGVEISKFASKNASKFGKVFNGPLEEFSGENFDIIVMNHVIEHIKDPLLAIKNVKTMLKEDGTLIIGTPDFDSGAARRYNSGFGTSTRAWTQGGTSAHGSSYVTLASTETFDGTNWSSDTNIPKNVGLHSHGCHVGSARTGFIVGGYERDSSDGSGAALVATHFQAS